MFSPFLATQMCSQKVISQSSLSPLAFSCPWGWFNFLQHHEAPEPIYPETFCRLHFRCPLLRVVSILKCLCNNFKFAGVSWLLKILIRLAWMLISCPVENLVSSPWSLVIPRRLMTIFVDTAGSHWLALRNWCFPACPCIDSLSRLWHPHTVEPRAFI